MFDIDEIYEIFLKGFKNMHITNYNQEFRDKEYICIFGKKALKKTNVE